MSAATRKNEPPAAQAAGKASPVQQQPTSGGVADDQLASGGVADDQPASGGVIFTIDRESDNAEPWAIYSSADQWTEQEIEEFKRLVSEVVRSTPAIVHRVKVGAEYDRFASAVGDVDDQDMALDLADEIYRLGL